MPLSNQQFRNILKQQQISLPSQTDAFKSAANDGVSTQEKKQRHKERREKKAARAKAYKEKLRLRQNEQEEREKQKTKYRDRAMELREGKNLDYADVGIDFESMDYNTSKYLGGDVKHTHMVKGLDFILLNRVRESMGKDEDIDAEFEEAVNESKRRREKEEAKKKDVLPWKSQFARSILEKVVPEAVFGAEAKEPKCETFYPGRMIYIFNKDSSVYQPLPKVLLRAKQECPDPFELNPVSVPGPMLKRLKNALKKKSAKSRKYKRKLKKQKTHSSKRRKLEDTKSNASKRDRYPPSRTDAKRSSKRDKARDEFNPIRAIEKSRRKEKEPKKQEDMTEFMDIDVFAGEGEYEAPKPKEKEPEKPKKMPRRPIEDVFGLSSLTGELAEKYTQKRNDFGFEERQMTQKQYERKRERQAEREWKQIQKIHEMKYGN